MVIGSVDTNVLLRAALQDVPEQFARVNSLLMQGEYIVSDVAITEAVHALRYHYKINRAAICDGVRALTKIPNLLFSTALPEALDIYEDHPSLSFEDCFMAVTAEHANAYPLYTFDQKLAKQTSAELVP